MWKRHASRLLAFADDSPTSELLFYRPFVVRTFTASRQLSARVAFTTVDRRSENALFTGLVRRAAVRTASLARSVPRG
jgi:hypothetical protein